jgi:hypothetical protein
MLKHKHFEGELTNIEISVAEYAQKPLFRVTCGDIVTKPEDVERYLKSVLRIGKVWDCGESNYLSNFSDYSLKKSPVVLLDEAEVFLQERSLQDINRNALVSGDLFLILTYSFHEIDLILTLQFFYVCSNTMMVNFFWA